MSERRAFDDSANAEPGDIVVSYTSLFDVPVATPARAEVFLGNVGGVDVLIGTGMLCSPVSKLRVLPVDDMPFYEIWRVRDVTREHKNEVASFAMEQLGKWQSITHFPVIECRILNSLLLQYQYPTDCLPTVYVGAELVAHAYQRVGVKFEDNPISTLPAHIVESPATSKIAEKTCSRVNAFHTSRS